MTERSGVSRRQVLRYGGLAAAVPLLPAVRPAKKASPSGTPSSPQQVTQASPQQVTQARLSAAVDDAGYVPASRAGRRGAQLTRCQLQFPAIRDVADLGEDS